MDKKLPVPQVIKLWSKSFQFANKADLNVITHLLLYCNKFIYMYVIFYQNSKLENQPFIYVIYKPV